MKSFKELADEYPDILENFLFGNGFSQSFYKGFDYTSLYESVKVNLTEDAIKLFEEVLNTTNFEVVLNGILTRELNKSITLPQKILDESYKNIKECLISAVYRTHPEYYEISTSIERLAWSLRIFRRNIFTTNYDLLTYWALIALFKNKVNVRDGFSRNIFVDGDLTFSPENFKSEELNFYYLHGALQFYEENDQIIKTEAKKDSSLLKEIEKQFNNKNFPLYVSEGCTEEKFLKIRKNKYLLTCLMKLIKIEKGLTIFGHSLSEEYDGHLINAINHAKNLEYIAYGIYPTESDTYNDIERRIKNLFMNSGKTLLFFDSRTFFDSVKDLANAGLVSSERRPNNFPDISKLSNYKRIPINEAPTN
ncbi:DUF4917 family protein [Bacillus sp. FSL K6-1109]|uniref:DUF4917 family protein n=1 Tax=Bacillus licheniformis TaxID=1402 RepID=A0AB37GYA9_BACLI|nr:MULTISPECIES: DUF4917 family protein [Bacillus]MBW4887040.1 DUF4917 family protein [Bacillus sp. (in: firmicutes)]MDE1398453.1 DUF4917 family protein [Bacillus licheniformis]MED1024968.1 DUF4917 family protein [Bacillus licheniformis]MED1036109.1 DUF4917 family protein [Bacillus licheniformis]MED1102020.1 DUF4917 family protein [Bacillus licheniformis]